MKTLTKLFTCTLACLFVLGNTLLAQTLTTDEPDYAPGDVVALAGTGFGSGETITLRVTHNPTGGDDATSSAHQPWSVTADGSGNFSTTWTVPSDQDEAWANLIATADGQSSGSHAEALFIDGPNGTGVVSVTANGGSCLGYTAAQSNGPDNWEVAEGGSYTITITGVTECSGDAITIFIQNSNTGNFCVTATGGNGTYSGSVTIPSPTCNTMPISYKCGGGQSCDNANTYNANGASNTHKVHFRASIFDGSCIKTGDDQDCNTQECVCAPPTNFTVDSISPVSALICWDAATCGNNNSFRVAWAKENSDKWQYRTVTGDHCTTFTNNYPTVYQIAIATICDDGDTTEYSSVFIFHTYPSCLPPANLSTNNIHANDANGNWSPASDAAKQNFWYRQVGTSSFTRKTVSATATSYLMKHLLPLTSYEWKVRSSCSDDSRSVNGKFTALQTFTTTSARLSLDENTGSLLNIYPNPTSNGNFVIALSSNSSVDHANITITNLLGQVIYQQEASINDGVLSQQVKFAESTPFGTYMIKVIAGESVYTTQLVYQP